MERAQGAVLCARVILIFLGEWKMTVIAAILIPLAALSALVGLYSLGVTVNVMTQPFHAWFTQTKTIETQDTRNCRHSG